VVVIAGFIPGVLLCRPFRGICGGELVEFEDFTFVVGHDELVKWSDAI
jgi:hypothetical protein